MLFRDYLIFNTLNSSLRLKNLAKLILVYCTESRNTPFGTKIWVSHLWLWVCQWLIFWTTFSLQSWKDRVLKEWIYCYMWKYLENIWIEVYNLVLVNITELWQEIFLNVEKCLRIDRSQQSLNLKKPHFHWHISNSMK